MLWAHPAQPHRDVRQHVLGITSRRETLLKALYMVIARDLIVEAGPPPEQLLLHRDHVVKQTFMRRASVVGARCSGNMEVDWADLSSDAVMNAMPAYRQMVNGNLRLRKPQHYEIGCCVDAGGTISRKTQVDNVFAAVVGAGIFGGVNHVTLAKSRWLSCSICLAFHLAGMLTNFLLPQAWELAFPDGIPSRTARSKTWTTSRRLRVPRRIVEHFG